MDVTAGDKLHITATGTVDFSDKKGVTPAGAPREWKDTLRDLTRSQRRPRSAGWPGRQ